MSAENEAKSDVARREEEILAFWNKRDIFKKSVEREPLLGEYVFYDGPPFATGLPHYGHIVASVIKDAVPRFWTMRGYRVPRRWGWDCHGLPIENIVEKEIGSKHKKDILALGVAKFNELCRSKVLMYADEWKQIIPRIGRWADMDDPYFTMDRDFMESVWWAFKQLYEKGLVYEDYRSMHICPRCETTLSQQEVSEGYKDVKDVAVTVKFKLKNPEKIGLSGDVYMLAWTTTPWTLPGNVALAVGAEVEYVTARSGFEAHIQKKGTDTYKSGTYHTVLLAKSALEKYPELAALSIGKSFKGQDLVGLEYEPPFDYYVNDANLKNRENGWKVYAADFVTAESGTGIAHEAPAFGADDWELLKQVNLPFVQHVNMDGTMKPEVKDFAGRDLSPRAKGKEDEVREVDLDIKKYLDDKKLLFSWEKYPHSYPHCWRCDTPLLNYATSSWFVSVTKIKENLLENAKVVNWSPEHIKEGRFGNWLEGARDWSISRQRFWASVIPIWVCETCKKQRVFGSAAGLEEASGKKIDDLHKHIVDEITIACDCGGVMRRIPDVLDTWFDSGSMPYGEWHYPFENKEKFDAAFPAQFIAEGLDQTRAWFYYLHVLSGAIFQKNAFQNVIVNGIVLAEDGKKMSKKLQNYPDPMEVVEKYGADALRLYLLTSPVMQAENLSFSEKGVDDVVKKNIGRLNNVLAFYQLYADPVKNPSGSDGAGDTPRDWKSTNVLDVWILARLEELIHDATEGFENYQLDVATRPIASFIDDLSVWYLRRSRDRFKTEGEDKTAALATLRYVLHSLSRVMAPSMPFFAEYLFQAIREEEDEESVHLATWPQEEVPANPAVISAMRTARQIVTLALEARDSANIKVRQPLSRLEIHAALEIQPEFLTIIGEEINVKEIVSSKTIAEGEVALDTTMTPELQEEGLVRELIRTIQQYRKETGMKPGEPGNYVVPAENITIAEKYRAQIEQATSTMLEIK